MPRHPRIHYPGAVYHVILRGNAGDPIFFDDRDRWRLYLFLQQAVEKFGCHIHGFCLMTNHLHLVLQVSEIPLSRIMQSFTLRYTKWINFTQERTGHLFQGRYKALLLDADAYLLELVRYVHLNPVRAGMVATPEAHPWSSHRAYAGQEEIPWLTTGWALSLFSDQQVKARAAYRAFVADGMGGARRSEFHRGTCEGNVIGDDRFAEAVLTSSGRSRRPGYSIADVVAAVCRSYGVAPQQLQAPGKARPFSEARALAALIVQESPHLTLTELGAALKRDLAPLGRAGQGLLRKSLSDQKVAARIASVRHRFGMAENQA